MTYMTILTHDISRHKVSDREEADCKYQQQIYWISGCPCYADGGYEIQYAGNTQSPLPTKSEKMGL